MTISLAKLKNHDFGAFLEDLPPTTVFVNDDDGRWHINPTILDEDEDCVGFELKGGVYGRLPSSASVEMMGRAATVFWLLAGTVRRTATGTRQRRARSSASACLPMRPRSGR